MSKARVLVDLGARGWKSRLDWVVLVLGRVGSMKLLELLLLGQVNKSTLTRTRNATVHHFSPGVKETVAWGDASRNMFAQGWVCIWDIGQGRNETRGYTQAMHMPHPFRNPPTTL